MPGILEKLTDHVTATATGDSFDRLQKRRDIKRQIAKCKVAAQRASLVQNQIDQLNQRADLAADQHSRITTPCQEKLSAIDAEIEVCILDHKPIPEALEAERGELLNTVQAANEALEVEVEKLQQLRGPLNKEREKFIQESTGRQSLEFRLSHPGIADPRRLCEQHACKQAVEWCGRRLTAAREQLKQVQTALRKIEQTNGQVVGLTKYGHEIRRKNVEQTPDYKLMAARVERWQFELGAAAAAAAEASEESNKIFREMIDE